MHCSDCQEHFSALLEGSEEAVARDARAHLALCPDCEAAYRSFREAVQALRALPIVAPPPTLLPRLYSALDAQSGRRSVASYWQPLTAGLSLAACCLIVLWTAFLSPVTPGAPGGAAPAFQPDYSVLGGVTPPGGTLPAPMAPTQAARPAPPRGAPPVPRAASRPRYAVARPVTRAFRMPSAAPQRVFKPFPDGFGGWGSRLAYAPVTGSSGVSTGPATASDKPAGTFAAPDAVTPPGPPLQPASGELQLSFVPPAERVVGAPAVGELTISGQAECNITVRVQPRMGLRVSNAPDGVLYQGPFRHGEPLKLPVRLVAQHPGALRLQVTVEADVEGLGTELLIALPEFASRPAAPAPATVTLIFKDTPAVRAIRELAAAANARVVLHDDLPAQLVTHDFSGGVPFPAALRVLCDACGYRLEERNGVYHVLK